MADFISLASQEVEEQQRPQGKGKGAFLDESEEDLNSSESGDQQLETNRGPKRQRRRRRVALTAAAEGGEEEEEEEEAPLWEMSEDELDSEEEGEEGKDSLLLHNRLSFVLQRVATEEAVGPRRGQPVPLLSTLSVSAAKTVQNAWKELDRVKRMAVGSPRFRFETEPLPGDVPFRLQGQTTQFSQADAYKRKRLKRNKKVLKRISKFWMTFSTRSEKGIRKTEYLKVAMLMAKALQVDFEETIARRIAKRDWKRDTKQGERLPFPMFVDALFELADQWTLTLELSEFLHFLDTLFHRIAFKQRCAVEMGKGVIGYAEQWVWRALPDVKSGDQRTAFDKIWKAVTKSRAVLLARARGKARARGLTTLLRELELRRKRREEYRRAQLELHDSESEYETSEDESEKEESKEEEEEEEKEKSGDEAAKLREEVRKRQEEIDIALRAHTHTQELDAQQARFMLRKRELEAAQLEEAKSNREGSKNESAAAGEGLERATGFLQRMRERQKVKMEQEARQKYEALMKASKKSSGSKRMRSATKRSTKVKSVSRRSTKGAKQEGEKTVEPTMGVKRRSGGGSAKAKAKESVKEKRTKPKKKRTKKSKKRDSGKKEPTKTKTKSHKRTKKESKKEHKGKKKPKEKKSVEQKVVREERPKENELAKANVEKVPEKEERHQSKEEVLEAQARQERVMRARAQIMARAALQAQKRAKEEAARQQAGADGASDPTDSAPTDSNSAVSLTEQEREPQHEVGEVQDRESAESRHEAESSEAWEVSGGSVGSVVNEEEVENGQTAGEELTETEKAETIETRKTSDGGSVVTRKKADGEVIETRKTADGQVIETRTTVDGEVIETRNTVDGGSIVTRRTADGEWIRTRKTGGQVIETRKTVDGDLIETRRGVDGSSIETRKMANGEWIKTQKTADGEVIETRGAASGELIETRRIPDGASIETRRTVDGELIVTRKTADGGSVVSRQTVDGGSIETERAANGEVTVVTRRTSDGLFIESRKTEDGGSIETQRTANGEVIVTRRSSGGQFFESRKTADGGSIETQRTANGEVVVTQRTANGEEVVVTQRTANGEVVVTRRAANGEVVVTRRTSDGQFIDSRKMADNSSIDPDTQRTEESVKTQRESGVASQGADGSVDLSGHGHGTGEALNGAPVETANTEFMENGSKREATNGVEEGATSGSGKFTGIGIVGYHRSMIGKTPSGEERDQSHGPQEEDADTRDSRLNEESRNEHSRWNEPLFSGLSQAREEKTCKPHALSPPHLPMDFFSLTSPDSADSFEFFNERDVRVWKGRDTDPYKHVEATSHSHIPSAQQTKGPEIVLVERSPAPLTPTVPPSRAQLSVYRPAWQPSGDVTVIATHEPVIPHIESRARSHRVQMAAASSPRLKEATFPLHDPLARSGFTSEFLKSVQEHEQMKDRTVHEWVAKEGGDPFVYSPATAHEHVPFASAEENDITVDAPEEPPGPADPLFLVEALPVPERQIREHGGFTFQEGESAVRSNRVTLPRGTVLKPIDSVAMSAWEDWSAVDAAPPVRRPRRRPRALETKPRVDQLFELQEARYPATAERRLAAARRRQRARLLPPRGPSSTPSAEALLTVRRMTLPTASSPPADRGLQETVKRMHEAPVRRTDFLPKLKAQPRQSPKQRSSRLNPLHCQSLPVLPKRGSLRPVILPETVAHDRTFLAKQLNRKRARQLREARERAMQRWKAKVEQFERQFNSATFLLESKTLK